MLSRHIIRRKWAGAGLYLDPFIKKKKSFKLITALEERTTWMEGRGGAVLPQGAFYRKPSGERGVNDGERRSRITEERERRAVAGARRGAAKCQRLSALCSPPNTRLPLLWFFEGQKKKKKELLQSNNSWRHEQIRPPAEGRRKTLG